MVRSCFSGLSFLFIMIFNQIKETCLYVADLDRSEYFYSQVIGLPLFQKVSQRHLFYRVGSSVLLLFNPEVTSQDTKLPTHFAYGNSHIALEVPRADYISVKKELMEKGISILQEQPWKEGQFSFYFRDPDGHLLEIIPDGLWDAL